MNVEREIPPIDEQPDQPDGEVSSAPENADSGEQFVNSDEVAAAAAESKKRDAEEIARIRGELGLETANDGTDLSGYLAAYLELEGNDVEKINFMKARDLPESYKPQIDALNDQRLENVTIAVVPDELWVKGSQPSESHAEKQMILMKQSYYETQENIDEIAWMLHELAHCQNFLDSESAEAYRGNMQQPAFEDLKTEYTYPNNPVEQYTFTKQFQYLREQGKSRQDILAMLGDDYGEEDLSFFNRLLDSVYE